MIGEFLRVVDLSMDGDQTVITSPKAAYTIDSAVPAVPGDLSDIHKSGDVALKIVRRPAENDLLENEATVIRSLWKEGEPEDKHRKYLPNLKDFFKLNERQPRHVNVFAWLKDFYTFEQIRAANPGNLRFEHGVWMFNRVLECLDALHSKRVVHGAVIPPHLMAFASENDGPMTHGVKLIDYTASVPIGGRISVLSQAWRGYYPPEVNEKKEATPATDIFMAVKSIIYVLGGNTETNELPASVPNYLARFLQGCLQPRRSAQRPKDAWALHEELEGLMERNFGPKQYFQFTMPKTA